MNSGYGLWEADLYGVGDALEKKKQARGWKANEGFEMVDTAYLQIKNGGEVQEEREMINLLMRWKGGTDSKTIFPGRLPWDQRDGVSLEMLKAMILSGAENNAGNRNAVA